MELGKNDSSSCFSICPLNAIGDGVNVLMLAHNLALQGRKVVFYHNTLCSLAELFPHFTMKPYPCYEADWLIIQPIKSDLKKHVLCALTEFCHEALGLDAVVRDNGFIRRSSDAQTIAFHIWSSTERKNWSKKRYCKVMKELIKQGFDVITLSSAEEKGKVAFPPGVREVYCPTLMEVVHALKKCRLFVGNDSGIGHIASSMHIRTITIAQREKVLRFWRPGFYDNEIITAPRWIPNFKLLRLRTLFWQFFISPRTVLKKIYKNFLAEN